MRTYFRHAPCRLSRHSLPPRGASGPLPSVAFSKKIPYFRDQVLTDEAGAPCRSIGLATINYLIYRFPTTISHSSRLTPMRQGKTCHFSEGKIYSREKSTPKQPVSRVLFPLKKTRKKIRVTLPEIEPPTP